MRITPALFGLSAPSCYIAFMDSPKNHKPLDGLPERDREIMARLLCMPPEQQKASPKPATVKGDAQRRRRERERHQSDGANGGS